MLLYQLKLNGCTETENLILIYDIWEYFPNYMNFDSIYEDFFYLKVSWQRILDHNAQHNIGRVFSFFTYRIAIYYNGFMFYILKGGAGVSCPPLCALLTPSCSHSVIFYVYEC